jgi:CarD family transcriptional regulator
MVKSKSLHEVAKVMRDMHRLRGSKNLSFGEQNLLDKAKGLLLRELSLAKRVTEQELEGQLEAALAS